MRKILAVALLVALSAAFTCHQENPPAYTWYPASSVAELKAQLNATDAPQILKIKLGTADTVWLQLIPQASPDMRIMADSNPPVNDSHRCPVDCP